MRFTPLRGGVNEIRAEAPKNSVLHPLTPCFSGVWALVMLQKPFQRFYHHATSVRTVLRTISTHRRSFACDDAPPARQCTWPPLRRPSEGRRISHSRAPIRTCQGEKPLKRFLRRGAR